MDTTRLLIPLDGSPLSEAALPWVRLLGAQRSLKSELLMTYDYPLLKKFPELFHHGDEDTPETKERNLAAECLSYLKDRAASLPGLEVKPRTAWGDAAQTIVDLSDEFDMIVMASHGRSGLGRWLLGSVALKVVRGAHCPVLVVAGAALKSKQQPKLGRILIPLDGSNLSHEALSVGLRLAREHGAEVWLYRALALDHLRSDRPELISAIMNHERELIEEYLKGWQEDCGGVGSRILTGEGSPVSGIVDAVAAHNIDLVVMSSHGRSGAERWLLGSVTEGVLQRAGCPVLVVRS